MYDRKELEAEAKALGLKFTKDSSDENLSKLINEGKAQVDAKAAADAKAEGEREGAFIVVTGPKKGRWRTGRHFTKEPTKIYTADLSEADGLALKDDPSLSVSFFPAD